MKGAGNIDNIIFRKEQTMLILRNIEKDDFAIYADYYPEGQNKLYGFVAVHYETGVIIRRRIADEYESKEKPEYSNHAAEGLMGIIEYNEEIPPEKVVEW